MPNPEAPKTAQPNPNLSPNFEPILPRRGFLVLATGAVIAAAGGAVLLNNRQSPEPTPFPSPELRTRRPRRTPGPTPDSISIDSPEPVQIEETQTPTEITSEGLRPGDAIYKIPNPNHRAAITIDDCIFEDVVQEYLDLANNYRRDGFPVSFTFFPRGDAVHKSPDIFKKVLAEGHELGTHTWSHPFLSELKGKAVRRQISDGLEAINDNVDPNYQVRFFRAPFGDGAAFGSPIDPEIESICKEFGLVIAGWDKDSIDTSYSFLDEQTAVEKALANLHTIRQGDIALFHANYSNSVATVREVINEIRTRGRVKVDKTLREMVTFDDSNNSSGVIFQNPNL